MPPKGRAPRGKLHVLAKKVAEKTTITDTRKQSFVIETEFAKGGFGRIYSAHQVENKTFGRAGSLAVKIEPQGNGPLFTEVTVFQRILKPEMLKSWISSKKLAHLGLPTYVSSGIFTYEGESLRFLVMPKFNGSLESYRSENGTLEPQIALTVAEQCANCLSYMQDQDYVHADVKADNILLGAPNAFAKCFLVDFGLAKMAKNNVEKPDKKKAHNGTAIFTSLDAHRGCSPSYRGDLEILAYNIIYWISGSLPWQKLEKQPDQVFAEKEKFSKNVDKSVEALISGSLSKIISRIFKIAYETPYTQKIDYDRVLSELETALGTGQISKTVTRVAKTVSTPKTRRKAAPRSKTPPKKSAKLNGFDDSNHPEEDDLPGTSKELVKSSRRLVCSSSSSNDSSSQNRDPSRPSSASSLKRRHDESQETIALSSDDSGVKKKGIKKKKIEPEKDKITGKASNTATGQVVNGNKSASKLKVTSKSTKRQPTSSKAKTEKATEGVSVSTNPAPSGSVGSPDASLRNTIGTVIPGVRNMKKVRRSLGATLVKKYINITAHKAN